MQLMLLLGRRVTNKSNKTIIMLQLYNTFTITDYQLTICTCCGRLWHILDLLHYKSALSDSVSCEVHCDLQTVHHQQIELIIHITCIIFDLFKGP